MLFSLLKKYNKQLIPILNTFTNNINQFYLLIFDLSKLLLHLKVYCIW